MTDSLRSLVSFSDQVVLSCERIFENYRYSNDDFNRSRRWWLAESLISINELALLHRADVVDSDSARKAAELIDKSRRQSKDIYERSLPALCRAKHFLQEHLSKIHPREGHILKVFADFPEFRANPVLAIEVYQLFQAHRLGIATAKLGTKLQLDSFQGIGFVSYALRAMVVNLRLFIPK